MERLLLEDFRCFDGKRDVRLAPITVLVGENSTGKSSFLAAVRAAWDLAFGTAASQTSTRNRSTSAPSSTSRTFMQEAIDVQTASQLGQHTPLAARSSPYRELS